MADIRPYQAFHYAPAAGDPADLVAPPYDKISDKMAPLLRARSPHNCVKLELGEGSLDPSDPEGRYQRSARTLAAWRAEGVLVRSKEPCLYVYQQSYELNGRQLDRVTLVTAGRVSPFREGVVKPHERTHGAAKLDRMELMKSTQANFGQIFMLYRDERHEVRGWLQEAIKGSRPLYDLIDYQKVRTRFYPLADPKLHARIHAFFRDQSLYIADGHHRYETAVAYRDLFPAVAADPDAALHFGQWALVELDDPGLHVYATHRLLHGVKMPPDLRARLAEVFEVTELPGEPAQALARGKRGELILVLPGGAPALGLRLAAAGRESLSKRHPPQVRDLDVTALHDLIIEPIHGLDHKAQADGKNITYLRESAEALELLAAGKGSVLYMLQPTSVHDVATCADAGLVMPQKSTDFFPKMLAGLCHLDLSPGQRILAPPGVLSH